MGTFFCDKEKQMLKKTITAELGRVLIQHSEEDMLELASRIYEERMPTRSNCIHPESERSEEKSC